MITGGNKQQRPGKSYLHGIVRDAVRPFAYRGSARRMLQADGGFSMRAQYGNGFMPVNFRYRQLAYYGYDSVMPGAPSAAVPKGGGFERPIEHALPGNSRGFVATTDAVLPVPPARADATMRDTVQGDAPSVPGEQILAPPVAATVDIRIPDRGRQEHSVGRAVSAQEPGKNRGGPPMAQPTGHKNPIPDGAAPSMGQRMPADMSLANLARALERHNFMNSNSAAVQATTATGAGASAVPAPRMHAHHRAAPAPSGRDFVQPAVDGGAPENESAMKPLPKIAEPASGAEAARLRLHTVGPAVVAGKAETPRYARKSGPASRAVLKPRPEQGRLPASAIQPVSMVPLRKHRPASAGREKFDIAPQTRTAQAAVAGKGRSLRAPRHKPVRHGRPVIVRQSAPAAFWERNYLSRFHFRMYR